MTEKDTLEPQNKLTGVIPPLVDLCVKVVWQNWEEYEFDFAQIPIFLKFKVLLCLQEHRTINEEDLYSIFKEDYNSLEISQHTHSMVNKFI
jgi:hypothetical protein